MSVSDQKSLSAVFDGAGQSLRVTQLPVRELDSGEVLVRVTCCTLCGSDLHTYAGHRPSPTPTVLGHEIVGRIEAKSEIERKDLLGHPLRVGDRVVWSVVASCGECNKCRRGVPQKCDQLFKYGHATTDACLSGGLSELCILRRGTAILRVADHLPDKLVAPASCATATVAAAMRAAGELRDRHVLILGAGMLGLTAAAFARCARASSVIVADPNDSRRELIARFGGEATSPSDLDTSSSFDVVFEMSGASEAVQKGIDSAGVAATIVLVGSVSPMDSVNLDPESVVRRLLTIRGVHNYRSEDLVRAVSFLSEHGREFPFEQLVEGEFSLKDVNSAFEFAMTKRPLRTCVLPDGT